MNLKHLPILLSVLLGSLLRVSTGSWLILIFFQLTITNDFWGLGHRQEEGSYGEMKQNTSYSHSTYFVLYSLCIAMGSGNHKQFSPFHGNSLFDFNRKIAKLPISHLVTVHNFPQNQRKKTHGLTKEPEPNEVCVGGPC